MYFAGSSENKDNEVEKPSILIEMLLDGKPMNLSQQFLYELFNIFRAQGC